MRTPHPDPEQIKEFAAGTLPPGEAQAVWRHLQRCGPCQTLLGGFSTRSSEAITAAVGAQTEHLASARTEARPGPRLDAVTPIRGILQSSEAAGTQSHLDTGSDGGAEPLPLPDELARHPRYKVLELIGAGGMGTVYKAAHRFMNRLVALKVVRRDLIGRPEAVARFRHEVTAAARLSHPNIVTAYDADACGAAHFLVMEYVPGTNLADLIEREGPLPVARACDYVRQAALGLQHAFVQGMVHRDIKPHNLILTSRPCPSTGTPTDVVKILDFGLARFAKETQPEAAPSAENDTGNLNATVTAPGTVMGTRDYIAPEQVRASAETDIRADIYSLGCTFYQLLTGRPPFADVPKQDKLLAHVQDSPPPVMELRPDVPAEVARVLERMMAKDPARRYRTPAAVATALAAWSGGGAACPAGSSTAPRRGRLAEAAALFLVAALVASWYATTFLTGPADRGAADATAQEVQRLEGHTGPVMAVAYSPDGRRLVSASHDGTLRLWDVGSGQTIRVFRGHTDKVHSVVLSADGKQALSGARDKTLRLWDVDTGREVRRFTGHTGAVTGVALSPDGLLAVSGGEDGTVRLWDVATGQERRRLGAFPKSVECVAFSHDGRRVLSGGWDQLVRLWDVASGRELRRFEGHTSGVKSVAFAPDDRRLVSGAEDRTVRVWDVDNGQEIRCFRHREWVWGVAYSHDGRRVLSASWDRTACLWDVEGGREAQRLDPDTEEVLCVAFSPDDRYAATAGSDKLVRLWQLPP